MSELWHPERSRKIKQRIIVTCDLVLETPAHFGNGDGDTSLMPLLVSPHDGRSPLLTGASIAGALRSYLGRFVADDDEKQHFITNLFGIERDDEQDEQGSLTDDSSLTAADGQVKEQSRLIIDDALGETSAYELRDGVHINAKYGQQEPVSRCGLNC
jgi:CRISPR/Cas system CSM-associated protein Csm3 (group 7 of RAMP superfamily)